MFSTTVLNIHFMENVNTVVSTQLGKNHSSGDRARVCRYADSIFVKGEGREEVVSTFSHVCLALRTWVFFFFGRRGVCGGTKFRAHAWAFLSARWWSHHRRIRANYYRFRMTTSAHTWSDSARSKRNMRSRFHFISIDSHTCGFKIPKSQGDSENTKVTGFKLKILHGFVSK